MSLIEQFHARQKKMNAYTYALQVMSWDSNTEAPTAAFPFRAEMQSLLSGEAFALATDPDYIALVEALLNAPETLSERDLKDVQKAHQSLQKIIKIPSDEFVAYQKHLALSQRIWEDAKAQNQYGMFQEALAQTIATQKRFVGYRAEGKEPYNVLLDDFEEGMTMELYDAFFQAIKDELVPFVKTILSSGKQKPAFIDKHYPKAGQKAFVEYLNEVFEYDLTRGVLKESVHPFTWNTHSKDVRYTVRYLEDFVFSSIFAAIHELGHAIYEMQVDESLDGTNLKNGASMGIHESQSRFYENVIGRSRAFWKRHYPKLQSLFPENLSDVSLDDFVLGINWVEASFIRVEADELTYPLHILIRYEMERAIFNDGVALETLPALWNEKVKHYLGLEVTQDSDGLLQDVHWSFGAFGYFPTYALGSAYAAQFYDTMRETLNIEHLCENNDMGALNRWLQENIHQYGSTKTPAQLLLDVTGKPFDVQHYIRYLKEKYTALYLT